MSNIFIHLHLQTHKLQLDFIWYTSSSILFQNSAIFGPFFISPFLIFSGYFIHLKDAHQAMHWLFHISFLKYALEGAALAIFGYDRPKMDCDEIYCHYVLPKKFMKTVDLDGGDYGTAVLALAIIFFILRILAYFVMSIRLKYKWII